MNRYIYLLLGYLVSTPLFAQNNLPAPLRSVTVVVKDSATLNPLVGVFVRVNRHHHYHQTGADGTVVIDSIREGKFYLQCALVGYHEIAQFMTLPKQGPLEIFLSPETYHLHEFEMLSQSASGTKEFSVQNKTSLSNRLIERVRGQNLGELFKQVNGVTLLSTGPNIAKPVIRGLHSNRIVLLSNGIRQEGQQWGAEHGPAIDPFTVNRVDVIKGASSVEFGPEAIGGVVRLSPPDFARTAGIEGEWSGLVQSNNGLFGTSLLVKGTQGKLNWLAQGSLRKAGDSRAPDYVISNTGFGDHAGLGMLRWSSKKLSVTGSMSFLNQRSGVMRAAHTGSLSDLQLALNSNRPLIIRPFTYTIGRPYQQVWHETQSLRLSYVNSTRAVYHLTLSRQMNSRQEYDLGVSWSKTPNPAPAYDLTLFTYQGEMIGEFQLSRHLKTRIGLSAIRQSNITSGIQQPIIPNFVSDGAGAFLFGKYARGRWLAEVGFRSDWRTLETFRRNTNQEIVSAQKNFAGQTFIAGWTYQFTAATGITTSLSTGWRPPSINELYSYGLHNSTATFEIGDAALRSEKSYNIDASIRHQTNHWVVEAQVFRNQIRDFVYFQTIAPVITLRGAFPAVQFTQTDVVLTGSDLKVTRMLANRWTTSLSGNLLYAWNLSQKTPLIFMPANRYGADVKYEIPAWKNCTRLFIDLSGIFVTRQTRYPAQGDYLAPPPAYFLLNLHAGTEIYIGKQPLRLGLGITNLLNTSYRDYLNRFRYFSDEAGINFTAQVSIPFLINTTQTKH